MVLIKVTEEMKEAAEQYAILSKAHTSRKHDFHKGGAEEASKKMYIGKIGEKVFAHWLDMNAIPYLEDRSFYYEPDEYDFLINSLKIDVKTRSESYHTRTLEMVKQFNKRPKDVYVSVYYNKVEETAELLGWIDARRLRDLHPIENNGYKDNYVAYDNDLAAMNELEDYLKKRMD